MPNLVFNVAEDAGVWDHDSKSQDHWVTATPKIIAL